VSLRSDATCRSCGAPMRWAESLTTKKQMPLDVEPTETGNIGVVEWVERPSRLPLPIVAYNPSTGTQATPYRYTSHFATCPQAAQWRKR
jgi:hypothetical protein